MKRHGRDDSYVVGEGVYTTGADEMSVLREPSTLGALRKVRFSRLGPKGDPVDENQRQISERVADAMTTDGVSDPDSAPAYPVNTPTWAGLVAAAGRETDLAPLG
jgi:hypothetical protein